MVGMVGGNPYEDFPPPSLCVGGCVQVWRRCQRSLKKIGRTFFYLEFVSKRDVAICGGNYEYFLGFVLMFFLT
jgi:hypothetical protein